MKPPAEIDVLLVGPEFGSCAAAAARAGLATDAVSSCLDAVVHVERVPTKVVVLSAREIEGREDQAVSALRRGRLGPAVLLTVPPRRDPASLRRLVDGPEDLVLEPFLPESLLARVDHLVRQRREVPDAVRSVAGTGVPAETLDDLKALNENISTIEVLKDLLLDTFVRRAGVRRASLMTPLVLKEGTEERDVLFIERARGLPSGFDVGSCLPPDQGIAGHVASTQSPLLVTDFADSPHRGLANGGPYAVPSCLSLPLKVRDRVLGIVNLADREDGERFTESDLERLGSLADLAAQILANAMRLERVTRLSIIDDLTGLYNRRFFRKSLDREFRRAQRYDRPLALAILDVDHFKIFNDQNGHEAGNRVLSALGEILRRSFRNTDIVARYGGEEFAIIFPEISKGAPTGPDGPHGAFHVLERLRLRVEATAFPGEQILPGGRLTLSGGAACFPLDARTVPDILVAADGALYRAKRGGRNRIVLAGEENKVSSEEE